MQYLIGGTWRELGAQGIHEPFKIKVEASSETEACEIVHNPNGKYYKNYQDVLIKTVIANFRSTSKNERFWRLHAMMNTAKVYLTVTDLDQFLQLDPNDLVIVFDTKNQQFTISKKELSNFHQI